VLNTRRTQTKFTNSTSKHGESVSTPDFYLGGSAFESRPGDCQLLPGVLWYSLVTPGELQSCVLQHTITMFLPVWDLGAISVISEDLSLLGYESVTVWEVTNVAEEQCLYHNGRMYTWIFWPLNVKAIWFFKMSGTIDPATLSYPRTTKLSCLFILSLHHMTMHNPCRTTVSWSSTTNEIFILLAWNIILPVVLYGCEVGLLH
jgi:hypothetical protein